MDRTHRGPQAHEEERSELVTNAVRHGTHDEGKANSGQLRVWLRPGRVRVEVTSPGLFDHPLTPVALSAEGGRGVQTV